MTTAQYKHEIWKRIRGIIKVRYQYGSLILAGTILGLCVVFLVEERSFGSVYARENLFDNFLTVVIVEFVVASLVVLWLRFYGVPSEIYGEQSSALAAWEVPNLPARTTRPPLGVLPYPGGVPQTYLLLEFTNTSGRILRNVTARIENLFIVSDEAADGKVGLVIRQDAAWDDGSPYKDIQPARPEYLRLAQLDVANRMIRFGANPNSPKFAGECLFELHVDFSGQLDGEFDVRRSREFHFVYGDPANAELLWAVDAVEQIPKKWRERLPRYESAIEQK